MATPTTHRPTRSSTKELAAAISTAPMVKTIAAVTSTGLRPKYRLAVPEKIAPIAANAVVDETISSC